jgi:putative membrane protein
MLTEALLAYAHFIAILTLVVFLTSEAALCRPEWLNDAVLQRLTRVDLVYLIAAGGVLGTGIARAVWGLKGADWYWSQPLLLAKLALFAAIGLISLKPTLAFRQWRRRRGDGGSLPSVNEIRSVRGWIMFEAHVMLLIPLAAVLLARGVGTR